MYAGKCGTARRGRGSESRQKGRKDVEGKRGEINRQLNWKVAEREGEVRARL